MKLSIKAGSTSQTINIYIQDSSSTVGAAKTGLVYNTSGLIAYYALPRATSVAITLATLAAVTSSYSSGGFKEIDPTNMPGWYRLDLPDAAIASGRFVSVHLQGVTDMAPVPIEIELTGWDNQDAVHGGLSSLPNVAAGATGGLPLAVDSSGRVDVLKINGTSQTARDIGASVLLSSGTGTGQLSFTSGRVKSDPWDVALPGAYSAGSGGYILGNLGAGADPWDVSLPGAYASGKAGYLIGTYVNASIAAVKTKTDSLTFTAAGYVDANTLKVGGTTQTARDIGASVLLSSGTGTGQVSLSSGQVKIQSNIKANVALPGFSFLMVDSSNNPRTGLTDCTGYRNIDGGAFSACANAVSEVSNGWYTIDLASSDLNGAVIGLRFVATGAQDRCQTIITTP